MLTSCKLTGIAETISAYHMSEENYYFAQSNGVESLGGDGAAPSQVRIYGGLSRQLGFKSGDALTQDEFTRLLDGRNRKGDRVTREHKVHGVDLTFSAPKSVSVAGLLTLRDPKIIEAHDRAVLETMSEIEAHCAGTQPRAGEHVKTGNLAYVTARDGFNRDHDPHLHTHVVIANMTAYDGKILAVDGRQIMTRDFNKMWGALYRAKLASFLKELGYAISYTKKGEMRLDAVSLEVEREFSGRRRQIEKAKKKGERDMDAWRKTRKDKDGTVEKKDVVAGWRQRLAQYAKSSVAEVRDATIAEREAWFQAAKWSVEAKQELSGARPNTEEGRWQAAARRATEASACVTEQAMITEYLAELGRAETWEHVTYADARQRLLAQVNAHRIVPTEDGRYTTWDLVRADRECIAEFKAPPALVVERAAARDAVAGYVQERRRAGRRSLSDRQASAAVGLLSSESGVVVVQGDAGAGKTTMLHAVKEIGAAAGWDVMGAAVQGVAARKLEQESGISSTTLAAYLQQKTEPRSRARLLVVDEASMLDSRNLADLLRSAESRGDKVVLVGDRNQLQSVGAGKPFERLVEAAEEAGELLSLNENYRQRSPVLRTAVDLAREGRMRESIEHLDKAGDVYEIEDTYLRRLEISKQYDAETLILTGTHQGREALNRMIRERLLESGEIDRKSERTYAASWTDPDGIRRSRACRLGVGDRITFLENEYSRYDVRNGEVGKVVGTAKNRLTVQLEDGREVALDMTYYSGVAHGYALTTYKSQGQTYDRVVVEADTRFAQLQDQRNGYVQITRARDSVRVYTDDRASLYEVSSILTSKRDTLELEASLSQATAMDERLKSNLLGRDPRRLDHQTQIGWSREGRSVQS